MFCLTVMAIGAQTNNSTEDKFLPSSASDCDCIVNAMILTTMHTQQDDNDDAGFFAMFYQISYIYYSMIGTMLTVIFGLIISYCTDKHDAVAIPKIIADMEHMHEGGFRTPGHFSVGSFLSLATHRRLSSFIHNVSQTTLKVENKLKEVISHSNLHHLPHLHVPADDEERISILNEEDDPTDGNSCGGVGVGGSGSDMHINTGKRKMFFIGHQDDRDHDE